MEAIRCTTKNSTKNCLGVHDGTLSKLYTCLVIQNIKNITSAFQEMNSVVLPLNSFIYYTALSF